MRRERRISEEKTAEKRDRGNFSSFLNPSAFVSPFRHATYLFGSEVLSHLLGFFSTLYYAQRVGVINFGWINFSLSLLSYGLVLTNFGLLGLGVRKVAQGDDSVPSAILSLRLLLSTVAFLLLFLFAASLRRPPAVKGLIWLYSLFLFINSLSLEWFFQAKEQVGLISAVRVLNASSYLALLLLLVREEGDFLLVPLAFLLSQSVGTVLLVVLFRRSGQVFRAVFDWKALKVLFLSALPLGATGVLQAFYVYFGPFFLGLVGAGRELGLYSAAWRLVYFTLLIDRVTSFLLLPRVSSFFRSNLSRLPRLFESLARIVLFFTLPVAGVVLFFACPILSLLFGSNYREGANILRLLILFLPLTTLSTLYTTGLIASNQERSLLRNTFVGTALNVVLAPLFYSLFRGMGVGLALLAGEATILLLNLFKARRAVRFSVLRSLVPVIARAEIEFLRQGRV